LKRDVCDVTNLTSLFWNIEAFKSAFVIFKKRKENAKGIFDDFDDY